MDVQFCAGSIGGTLVTQKYVQDLQALAALNFTTTAYDIEAYANSDVVGDITLESFEIVYYQKTN